MKTIIMLWCKAMIGRIVIKLLLRTVTKIVKTEKKRTQLTPPSKPRKYTILQTKQLNGFHNWL